MPSGWCIHDPKEHKEERDLCGNWVKTPSVVGEGTRCFLNSVDHHKNRQ